jgi:hypothetical protein
VADAAAALDAHLRDVKLGECWGIIVLCCLSHGYDGVPEEATSIVVKAARVSQMAGYLKLWHTS